MAVKSTSYLTGGVAMVAASAIALTPLTATPQVVAAPAVPAASAEVALAASSNFFAKWIEEFNTASANAGELTRWAGSAPAPTLQQLLVNQFQHVNTLINDPTKIGAVLKTIGSNANKAFVAATALRYYEMPAEGLELGKILLKANDDMHTMFVAMMPLVMGEDLDLNAKKALAMGMQLLASPLSGALIGLVGPLVSPVVALLNSVHSIATTIGTDPGKAIRTLLNMPATVVGSFFNGATLDISAVAPLLGGILPAGTAIHKLNIAFGGLFSTGYAAMAADGTFTPGPGGSLFNSIGMDVETNMLGSPMRLDLPGNPVGPLAALANLSRLIAVALGWNGTGNPITEVEFPQIESTPAPSALSVSDASLAPPAQTLTLDIDPSSSVTADLSTGGDDAAAAPDADPTASDSLDDEPAATESDLGESESGDSIDSTSGSETDDDIAGAEADLDSLTTDTGDAADTGEVAGGQDSTLGGGSQNDGADNADTTADAGDDSTDSADTDSRDSGAAAGNDSGDSSTE